MTTAAPPQGAALLPAALAATHLASTIAPRAWSAAEFAALLADPAVLATGDARAFALGRLVLDEAEVLTLATHPSHRRQGLARAALAALLAALAARGALRVFLEVAADNDGALALYQAAGFRQAGRRRGYYGGTDALVLVRVGPESDFVANLSARPVTGDAPPV
jgi:ribosomal-protein-alanine N-acetyltransferase